VPARLPPPGPSYLRPLEVRVRDRELRVGIGVPTAMPDGWWIALVWAADDAGVITCRDAGPEAGPPPDPPAGRVGTFLAGALSGYVAEEDGRQAIKVRLPIPGEDERRPWDRPLVVQVALRWEPARAATMRPSELAGAALEAFARAVADLGRG
jgi:hypothetical protein